MADKSSKLLRLVQERALSKKKAAEEKRRREEDSIPYVAKDCISDILIRLPFRSLQRSRFVCKPWYKITNTSDFIDTHLSRSENILIFLSKVVTPYHPYSVPSVPQENPYTFSIEAKLSEQESFSIFKHSLSNPKSDHKIKYLEIKDGKCEVVDYKVTCLGPIRSSCNGIIILDNRLKKGGVIAFNPVTRKLIVLPLGTICPPRNESYGLAFCKSRKQFKLVHLFMDELKHISCEILDIGTRSWRVVDGPSLGLFTCFGYNPVHAIGALHWFPHMGHSECIVSITIENEQCHKILLPKSSNRHDRIVDIGGLLGFVTHEGIDQIDVWVLRSLFGKEWTKVHSIAVLQLSLVPLYCTKFDGEVVFKSEKDSSLHVYDFRLKAMRKIEMENVSIPSQVCCLPHVNSLVSWETHREGENMDDY